MSHAAAAEACGWLQGVHWRVSGDACRLAAATYTTAEHWKTGLAVKPLVFVNPSPRSGRRA